jgi:23S rRNA (adenine2503-C2)-methyltransferase
MREIAECFNLMKILGKYGKSDLAILYIAEIDGKIVEFVESVQPPIKKEEKWVLIISTLYGCPMKCLMCDAGEYYHGIVDKNALIKQIDYLINASFPDSSEITIKKVKIQFARMGEPSINPYVLELLEELPNRYKIPGLIPCVSTIAPNGTEDFFDQLLSIKNTLYSNGKFQLQFSIHSSDEKERVKWLPSNIWDFSKIAAFGKRWYRPGDRKITLNFAVSDKSIIEPSVLVQFFDPQYFFIKLTPINPTNKAERNNLQSGITVQNEENFHLVKEFQRHGYEVLLSIGAWEENQIGSNCGQFATKYVDGQVKIKENYTCTDYQLKI